MKPVPILVALLTLGAALGAVSWLSRSTVTAPNSPPQSGLLADTAETKGNPLEVAKTGPFPKAVALNGTYEFGSMELGSTMSHNFVIRNDGEAPLRLKKGIAQCKCTEFEVPEGPIAPGESVEVLTKWKPADAMLEFHQMVNVWTNDPDHEKVELHVKGLVADMVSLSPHGDWQLNRINSDGPIEFRGTLTSPILDQFQILGYQSSSSQVTTEFEPFTEAELKAEGVKSGYKVLGKFEGEAPVGRFRATLTLKTDMDGGRDFTVQLAAMFPGPFSILGEHWLSSDMRLDMGNVKAHEGKSMKLSMFVAREEGPIELNVKEAHPDFLQLALTRDETFKVPNREKYLMIFTVLPGAPLGSWQGDHLAKILVSTNRKDAPELELYVNMTVTQ